MSNFPSVRRADKQLEEAACWDFLRSAYSGTLATVSAEGWPYATPLLHVVAAGAVWLHTTSARGHLRTNVEATGRGCFTCAAPGEVFPYGRFECDTALAYTSVVAFGPVELIDDTGEKAAFFDALMAKYARPGWQRPASFYPRLADVTVYRLEVQHLTGKHTALPAASQQWPQLDRTRTPQAVPPGPGE